MSHTAAYVFTSVPTRPNQSASNTFREYRNPGQIPATIGECNVYPLTLFTSRLYNIFKTGLGLVVFSILAAVNVGLATRQNAVKFTTPLMDIFPETSIVVSFEGRELMERIEARMAALSFKKDSSAGRHEIIERDAKRVRRDKEEGERAIGMFFAGTSAPTQDFAEDEDLIME